MVLGFGTVHPPGEADADYDGFFFRADEMPRLATEIVGKPLCIEHDTSEPVGKVTNAWVGRDKALNVIFETDPTFKGFLAENLLVGGVTKDLSLGHDVKLDRRNLRVLDKMPTEVSICVKGDRDGTHVRTVGREFGASRQQQRTGYIKDAAPHPAPTPTPSMSSEEPKTTTTDAPPASTTTTETPAADPVAPAAATGNGVNSELLDLITKQQGELAAMKLRYEEEQKRAQSAEAKAAKLGGANKRKRAGLIDGAVKKLVQHLLATDEFKDTLKPQEAQIDAIMEGLKDSEDAAPLVDVVACAASALRGTTTRLEEEFQARKKLKTEVDALKEQIATYQKPALESARERFGGSNPAQAPSAPSAPPAQPQWSRVASRMPRGMKPMEPPKDGVQVRNPAFWKSLVAGGTRTGTGMGWFDEGNLVGKNYEPGQRPTRLPAQNA